MTNTFIFSIWKYIWTHLIGWNILACYFASVVLQLNKNIHKNQKRNPYYVSMNMKLVLVGMWFLDSDKQLKLWFNNLPKIHRKCLPILKICLQGETMKLQNIYDTLAFLSLWKGRHKVAKLFQSLLLFSWPFEAIHCLPMAINSPLPFLFTSTINPTSFPCPLTALASISTSSCQVSTTITIQFKKKNHH